MSSAAVDQRLPPLSVLSGTVSPPTPPRHQIEPVFGFVEFSRIKPGFDREWFTRNKKDFENRGKESFAPIELMAENIGKEGVLEPLHLLYEGAVPVDLWDDKVGLWAQVDSWEEFTVALGFRRYLAVDRAIEKGWIERDNFRVPARIYLKCQLEARLQGESVEHFLTKAAVSSNVFFKGYTIEDKVRLTRTLILQLRRCSKNKPRHRDILHLLGIKTSESAADHKASLRRFKVCSNDTIYEAYCGESAGKTNPRRQVLTLQLAEHLANRLGHNDALVTQFLELLGEEVDGLLAKPSNRLRKDKPAIRLIGFDSPRYRRWIDNLLVHGEAKADELDAPSYSFQLKVQGERVSIPSVSLDLKDSSRDAFARTVDVYFKVNALAQSLRKFLLSTRPHSEGGHRRAGSGGVPPVTYGQEYKEFIRRNHLERFANIGALRKLYDLDDDLCDWVLPEDQDEYAQAIAAGEEKAPSSADEGSEKDGDEIPGTQAEVEGADGELDQGSPEGVATVLKQSDVGEKLVNQWIIKKVVAINSDLNQKEKSLDKNLLESKESILDLVQCLPVIAGTFAAYSKSLASFSALREVVADLGSTITMIATKSGVEGTDLLSIERKLDVAAQRIEQFTPDREAADRISLLFEDLLTRKPAAVVSPGANTSAPEDNGNGLGRFEEDSETEKKGSVDTSELEDLLAQETEASGSQEPEPDDTEAEPLDGK